MMRATALTPMILSLVCLLGCNGRQPNEDVPLPYIAIFPSRFDIGQIPHGRSTRRVIEPAEDSGTFRIESVIASCACTAVGVQPDGSGIWVEAATDRLGERSSSVLIEYTDKNAVLRREAVELHWLVDGMIQPVSTVYHLGVFYPGQRSKAQITWTTGGTKRPNRPYTVELVLPGLLTETVEVDADQTSAEFQLHIPKGAEPKLYSGKTKWRINGIEVDHQTYLEVAPAVVISPSVVNLSDSIASHKLEIQCDPDQRIEVDCPSGVSWQWTKSEGRVRSGLLIVDGAQVAEGDCVAALVNAEVVGTIVFERKQ